MQFVWNSNRHDVDGFLGLSHRVLCDVGFVTSASEKLNIAHSFPQSFPSISVSRFSLLQFWGSSAVGLYFLISEFSAAICDERPRYLLLTRRHTFAGSLDCSAQIEALIRCFQLPRPTFPTGSNSTLMMNVRIRQRSQTLPSTIAESTFGSCTLSHVKDYVYPESSPPETVFDFFEVIQSVYGLRTVTVNSCRRRVLLEGFLEAIQMWLGYGLRTVSSNDGDFTTPNYTEKTMSALVQAKKSLGGP
ncbi:hypothetical protein WG66_014060 [Moniliophthora roreri]|nr:hypothetical protein WG66_014060 [Moniliophthora roreri]